MPGVTKRCFGGGALIVLCLYAGFSMAQDDPPEFGGPIPALSILTPSPQMTDLKVRDDLMTGRYVALFDLRADGRIPRFVESDTFLLTVRVRHQGGAVVRTLVDQAPAERFHYQVIDHGYSLPWDGTDDAGQRVPPGPYRFEIAVVMPSRDPATVFSAWFDVR